MQTAMWMEVTGVDDKLNAFADYRIFFFLRKTAPCANIAKIVKEFCFIKSMSNKLFGTAGANDFLPELADCKTVSLLLPFFALSL